MVFRKLSCDFSILIKKKKTIDFLFLRSKIHANSPFDETVFICFDKVAVEMYV